MDGLDIGLIENENKAIGKSFEFSDPFQQIICISKS